MDYIAIIEIKISEKHDKIPVVTKKFKHSFYQIHKK